MVRLILGGRMEEYKGIYAYVDKKKKTEEIIYIGKDSSLYRKICHSQHHQPSKYDVQRINQILQSNPDRYEYVELIRLDKNITDDELTEYEIKYIALYNPKFNFTEGGDGFGSGENNPFYGKTGKDNLFYKDYARVIKSGSPTGKQIYSLEYDSKTLTTSIDKEKLEKLAEEINNGADPNILLEKPLAVINKDGTRRGEQYYAVVVDEERIKISRDLELLQKICDDINNGEEVEITLNKYKAPPKIAKAGKTADGKQYFSLIYDGKRIKRSADKEYLQKVMDDINEGVEVEAALKRNMKTSEIKPPNR